LEQIFAIYSVLRKNLPQKEQFFTVAQTLAFCEESAQFCQKIAQNRALLKMIF
jgi:hypothetical protein